MKTMRFSYSDRWELSTLPAENADLVIAFGQREKLTSGGYADLRTAFPNSTVIAGSTVGEISNDAVLDGHIVATAIWFDHVEALSHAVTVDAFENSKEAGKALAGQFERNGLRFIFVLSDGQKVNGS